MRARISKSLNQRIARDEGFSLVEMMIVITLISVITGLVGTRIYKQYRQSQVQTTKITMKQLMTTIEDFRRACGFYPMEQQGLDALVNPPQGRECKNYEPGGFLKKLPKDAWNNDFLYTSDGNKFELKSLGSDAKEAGADDAADISSKDLET